MVERLYVVITSIQILIFEGVPVAVMLKVWNRELIDVVDLNPAVRSFPEEVLRRTEPTCTEEDEELNRMLLGEACGSYLVVDIEEGIANEIEVVQSLHLIGRTELILVTGEAVFVAVADIHIVLLSEVVLDVTLHVTHLAAVTRSENRARAVDLVGRRATS